mmetsp:Transcript_25628/g.55338  ORF Transcript_25628/g.55338 Transcript_25628/m.55338 type:complete len:92 (-) Transcript_25628:875-1150(-)
MTDIAFDGESNDLVDFLALEVISRERKPVGADRGWPAQREISATHVLHAPLERERETALPGFLLYRKIETKSEGLLNPKIIIVSRGNRTGS